MSLRTPLCRPQESCPVSTLEEGNASTVPPATAAANAASVAVAAATEVARTVSHWSAPVPSAASGQESGKHRTRKSCGCCNIRTLCSEVIGGLATWFSTTTDAAFIRSEVNGRKSRRIVLLAFLCTDVIGAILWASWCNKHQNVDGSYGVESKYLDQLNACNSFGINHFVWLAIVLPLEGAFLLLVGWNPCSFWSDFFLLPMWLVRLVVFDALLWNVPPETLVGDALWFSVLAVMCRVHSLALGILVVSQVASLYCVIALHGGFSYESFELVRYGHYSAAMLLIVTFAYMLDEQSRLSSFSDLMYLQDKNASLAETLLSWKMLTESGNGFEREQSPTWSVVFPVWRHRVHDHPESSEDGHSPISSRCSWPSSAPNVYEPLPLPTPSRFDASRAGQSAQQRRAERTDSRSPRAASSRATPKAPFVSQPLRQWSKADIVHCPQERRKWTSPRGSQDTGRSNSAHELAPTTRPNSARTRGVAAPPPARFGGGNVRGHSAAEAPLGLYDVVE